MNFRFSLVHLLLQEPQPRTFRRVERNTFFLLYNPISENGLNNDTHQVSTQSQRTGKSPAGAGENQ